ncbi:hypothetical protein [Leuconostoc citreum]|uniref:hypothetical protein n=1 Tax=Leuconostoc citreum TaxID=33964 RepID=UPI0032DF558C
MIEKKENGKIFYMFRPLSNPYISTPKGEIRNENGFVVDSEDNVFEFSDGQYVKVGFIAPFVKAFQDAINTFSGLSFAVALSLLFFPRRNNEYVNKNDREARNAFNVVEFVFILLFALSVILGVVVGWILNKLSGNYSEAIAKFLDKHKVYRLFVPNLWFSGKHIITGLCMLATPVLIIITIIVSALVGNDPLGGMAILYLLSIISLAYSVFSIIFNIILNASNKVLSL